jgi:hypothetical protein
MIDDQVMAIAHHGNVVGTLVQQKGERRLSWLDGADPRLRAYAGSLDDELPGELADRLAARLGARSASEVGLAVVSVAF